MESQIRAARADMIRGLSSDFQKLDFIVCTIDVSSALPLTDLTSCLWGESTTEVCLKIVFVKY